MFMIFLEPFGISQMLLKMLEMEIGKFETAKLKAGKFGSLKSNLQNLHLNCSETDLRAQKADANGVTGAYMAALHNHAAALTAPA